MSYDLFVFNLPKKSVTTDNITTVLEILYNIDLKDNSELVIKLDRFIDDVIFRDGGVVDINISYGLELDDKEFDRFVSKVFTESYKSGLIAFDPQSGQIRDYLVNETLPSPISTSKSKGLLHIGLAKGLVYFLIALVLIFIAMYIQSSSTRLL